MNVLNQAEELTIKKIEIHAGFPFWQVFRKATAREKNKQAKEQELYRKEVDKDYKRPMFGYVLIGQFNSFSLAQNYVQLIENSIANKIELSEIYKGRFGATFTQITRVSNHEINKEFVSQLTSDDGQIEKKVEINFRPFSKYLRINGYTLRDEALSMLIRFLNQKQ